MLIFCFMLFNFTTNKKTIHIKQTKYNYNNKQVYKLYRKLNMLSLQSPHNGNRPQFLQQAISPTFRNKRIPSAHQSYSYSSNHNLKICKVQSPSKLSQKFKRRKSQYINSSSSYLDKNDFIPQKKKSSKFITQINTHVTQSINNHPVLNVNGNLNGPNTPSSVMNSNNIIYPQNIINEMNCLKNEYKQLKSAYQQLIEEKINNSQKMAHIKNQNRKLQAQLQIALQKLNTLSSFQNNPSSQTNNSSSNCNICSSHPATKPTLTTSSSFESISPQQMQFFRVQNQKLRQKNTFNQQQLQRIKKQCYKLLQAQKFKCKKLQQSLKEKGTYITYPQDDLLRIFSRQKYYENQQYSSCANNYVQFVNKPSSQIFNTLSSKNLLFAANNSKPQSSECGKNIIMSSPKMISENNINRVQDNNNDGVNLAQESLFISQDKSFVDNPKYNQSQFISISLTSVMDESVCRLHDSFQSKSLPKPQPKLSSKHQIKPHPMEQTHLNLTQSTQTVLPQLNKQPSSKRQKLSSRQNQQNIIQEPNYNMKKMRKQVHHKLQLNLNHFDNNKKQSFLNLKTPLSNGDKKLMGKNKNSKSKKKDDDKQNNLNYYHGKDVSDLNVGKVSKKKDKNHSLTHK